MEKISAKNLFPGILVFLVLILLCGCVISIRSVKKKQPVYWGVFQNRLPDNPDAVHALEKRAGKKPAMIMWYIDWKQDFPVDVCRKLYEYGCLPHIAWEPWFFGDMESIKLKNILGGDWDAYLARFGRMMGEYGKPVMIRLGHEMNGNWYPWSGALNDASPGIFIKAFRYVHDAVIRAGGTNGIWIWAPNITSVPAEAENSAENYYPGDEYVDWIGIDGYNWGTAQPWSRWETFADIFSTAFAGVQKLFPAKPVMVAEFGCSSTGGDKKVWIENFFKDMTENYPHVRAWVWFNVNKETDWRFDADPESFAAFKKGLADQRISGNGKELAKLHKNFP